jgi:biofilm PGA synthesis N-glycosyltransferase PgaC
MLIALWLLLISAVLIVYCYFLYPLMVIFLARYFPKPVRKEAVRPVVTILIPAHNEGKIIREKIENSLALDYPRDRIEIIVVSDGSTDETADIAREYGGRGVTTLAFRKRRGKVASLIDAIPRTTGEILLFSDASGMLRPDALYEMVSNFADEEVGCVCGYYRSPGLAGVKKRGELLYWDYEFAIKRAESQWETLLGATGAMYAVRKNLFIPPKIDTINDDFVIPALLVLGGHRTVLEERAVVDDTDPHMGAFGSRVRVAMGNWQQLVYLKKLLSPFRPRICWIFLSHKLIRMLVPLLVLLAFVSLIVLLPFAAVFIGVIMLLAALTRKEEGGSLPLGALRKFFTGNVAGLCGMVLYVTGRGRVRWK